MWRHSMGHDKLRFANVSGVLTESLLNGFDMSEIQRNDTIPKEFVKYHAVVPVGSDYDERQRDACAMFYLRFGAWRYDGTATLKYPVIS